MCLSRPSWPPPSAPPATTTPSRSRPGPLRVFAHQFARNAPYRAFCERRGVTPATVASWEDVPPVPTAAFRHADLACGPPQAVFRTSGTGGGAEARGRHLVPAPRPLPRLGPDRLRALPRCPTARGCRRCSSFRRRRSGPTPRSCACATGSGEELARRRVVRRRGRARRAPAGRPAARARSVRRGRAGRRTDRRLRRASSTTAPAFRLGPGSRVMDTGGAKGMPRPALARRLPARVLDAARRRRLLLRQRVRHDRALLAALRERAPRSLRRPQPRRRAGSSRRPGCARACSIPTRWRRCPRAPSGSSAITISPTPAPSRSC